MLKYHNRNTRTRWGISSKLTIKTQERRHWPRYDVFIVNFTYFTCYCRVWVCIVDFEQENVCEEPVLWISIYPRAEQRHHFIVFIFNFEHISHLVLVLLLLILSMYLIARFDIVYSLLERISTNWNANPIASSSKQDIFIINFNANCNVNFFYPFYLLINEINSYLLTCSISTICKNSNSSPWPNSFLNIHIWKFKCSNISSTEYKPTKNPLWKI